jgi:hypothetical protein
VRRAGDDLDREHDARKNEPGDECQSHADRSRARLREQRINQCEDHVHGIDGKACDRALRNEVRVVIERKKNVNRSGANRQRRHQAADQGADAFGYHRRRQHKAGRDSHFYDQNEREIDWRGHFQKYHMPGLSCRPGSGD